MRPQVAPPQHRQHRQPRSSELAAAVGSCMAAAACGSEPSCITQRPPVADLQQPAEERAPEAGTSSESAQPKDELAAGVSAKKKAVAGGSSSFASVAAEPARRPAGEESARERLKRHRTEMAGRVRVPDMWGQERLLKDWVDCAVFDRPLAATAGLLNARDALVAECVAARRPPAGRPLRVQNGCS